MHRPYEEQKRRRKPCILTHTDTVHAVDGEKGIEKYRKDKPENPCAPPVQKIQIKPEHRRRQRHLKKGVKRHRCRVVSKKTITHRQKYLDDKRVEIGMVIGFCRHAKRLLHLPHRIVVKPSRIIHKKVRQIAEQAEKKERQPDPPTPPPRLPRRKHFVIKGAHTRGHKGNQRQPILRKKARRKQYGKASRRPKRKPSHILRIAVVHRALPVSQHDKTGTA